VRRLSEQPLTTQISLALLDCLFEFSDFLLQLLDELIDGP
jgi:hypothetical protein